MADGYASRMAQYAGKRKAVERPVLSYRAPLSAEVMSRTMGTPAQRALMKNTADIFSKTAISSDPVAQAGALDMQQGDIGLYPYPVSAAGVTYSGNYLPGDFAKVSPVEQDMIARSGFNIGNLKNKIVLGPDAIAGETAATIPHELGHRGMNVMQQYSKDPFSSPYVSPSRLNMRAGEPAMRAIAILRGEDVQRNLEYLNDTDPRRDGQPWTPQTVRAAYGPIIDDLQGAATSYLRQRGLK